MKKMKLLFLLLGTLISCDKDSDDLNASLNGKWALIDVQCFCGITENDLSKNTLVFDSTENTATFANSEDPGASIGFRRGTYDFSISNDSLKFIGSFDYEPQKSLGYLSGAYTIKSNTLTIAFDPMPGFIDDEFTLIYKKRIF